MKVGSLVVVLDDVDGAYRARVVSTGIAFVQLRLIDGELMTITGLRATELRSIIIPVPEPSCIEGAHSFTFKNGEISCGICGATGRIQ